MSETEKTGNSLADSQDTVYEKSEETANLDSSRITNLSESQDFCLIDLSDDGSSDKLETNASEKPEAASPSRPTANTETRDAASIAETEKTTSSDTEVDKPVENESATKIESPEAETEEISISETCCLPEKEKHSEDEEEIIQCTPPETHSPSKIRSITNTETGKLKRKAESFDEPPRKVLRTNSREDALTSVNKRLEEDADSYQDVTTNCTNANVVIAETQELEEETLEETTKNKEVENDERLKRQDPQVRCSDSDSFEKTYEVDKNENLNELSKLSPPVANENSSESISPKENADPNSVTQEDNASSKLAAEEKKLDSTNNVNHENAQPAGDEDTEVNDSTTAHSQKNVTKENGVDSTKDANLELNSNNGQQTSPSNEMAVDSLASLKPTNKSRMSVEVVYDKAIAGPEPKSKPKELVQIDEDGEKIILDSSQEDSDLAAENYSSLDNTKADTTYKTCYETKSSSDFSYKSVGSAKETSLDSTKSDGRIVNGSSESKRCDTDSTASLQSDMFADGPGVLERADANLTTAADNLNKPAKTIAPVSKDGDHADLVSVSDNEPDVSIADDSKSKSDLTHSSTLTKALQVEKEVGIYVRMKCLIHVDESTKEFLSKEVTNVHCESVLEPSLRPKNNDTSASLADISGNDNKDSSPGSVNSNQQLYQLNPRESRLSCASTISSLSSVSSAASLAAKLAVRDAVHFSLPRAPTKHAKKHVHDVPSFNDKQLIDESYERLTKEWQNSRLLTTTILNFANVELHSVDTCNVSNERIDDQMQKIRSSTPEVKQDLVQIFTPKSGKKGKAVKRPRSKSAKSDAQTNGLGKVSPKAASSIEIAGTPSKKKIKGETAENTLPLDVVRDELIGKEVFAKWSDNNYYPGTVIDKVKMKYKVNFYDGKTKLLIEDFVIPIPKTLNEGLSVYATTTNDDYGSCGIIVDIQSSNNVVNYIVETDEGERIQVQIKDISLSSDQAQVLKEELTSDAKSLPATPKHLGQVTLENMVEGKRRSKRIATPVFSTPKSRSLVHTPSSKNILEPSVSGMASKYKKEKKISSESEDSPNDLNVLIKEDTALSGVQQEIIGTPNEQVVKGPQSRIKSKPRSKKKTEDEETIATLGPIPAADSTLFKGMSFILTCAPLETIDRYQVDNRDCSSDPGTENEEEWAKKPFVRERLRRQIIAGGGKVYDDFSEIPQEEYKDTKLITNVPNTTAKTLLCLSVGIPAYNHNWIIRCCQENKVVSQHEDKLPAGWSLDKQSYVEMFQRLSNKPLTQVVVIIPVVESETQFSSFWRQICENAGAVVLLAENPDSMEGFVEGTVVVSNKRCPAWTIERANELQIPLLSTTWIVQCLIEGQLCSYDSQPRYKYNFTQH